MTKASFDGIVNLKERIDWSHYTVTKRSGSIVTFQAVRIKSCLEKAINSALPILTPEERSNLSTDSTKAVLLALEDDSIESGSRNFNIEDIQDTVEEVLVFHDLYTVARAYAVYREQHKMMRELEGKAKESLMDSYLENLDWQVSENANMTFSLQGLNNFVASEITKKYWLDRIYPPEVSNAHSSGDFHLHDLNLLAVYCVGWDLADLLTEGFQGVPGKVESKPPRHFRAALGQVVNFFYTLQGEAAGAQAFSSLDTYLAPFIRYDQLDYSDVKQAMQEFVYNMNVPTRVGFQTPFTNITMDLQVPENMKNDAVIYGGVRQDVCYGDFQREMNMFNRAFLEVMSEGDAKGRVFTFPIPTYNITKDFNYDDPRLTKLWEVTAKYGVPYFANFVNSDMSPEDTRSMCCRLRMDLRQLARRGGGLFGANPLTGSIGVVTLNLPRLGYEAKGSAVDFFERLSKLIEISAQSLEIKRKTLERFTERNLYPYSKFYLRNVKLRSGEYWSNHFSTIGIVGLNEAALNLMGEGLDGPKGRVFGLQVMDFLRAKLEALQLSTNHNYNLEATPAEGTSYRLAMSDKKKWPDIIVSNESAVKGGAEPYYTNSSQFPVDFSDDIFEVLDKQDEFQSKYTGGTVQHVFVGEAIKDPVSVKNFIKTAFSQYKLPYMSVTPTFSVCPSHGYLVGEHAKCPTCGVESEVYSRVVGYLRPVRQWNAGKQAEFIRRTGFSFEESR